MRTHIFQYEHDEGDLLEVEVVYTFCNKEVNILETKINGLPEKLDKKTLQEIESDIYSSED